MEARPGQPLTPESVAEHADAEAGRSRRWAYFALGLALLATIGAAIAIIFLVEATNESRELRDDLRRLEERSEAARRARSEAGTAEQRSRSLREQVEDLEVRVEESNDRADATQRQVSSLEDELRDDIQQLRDEVERRNR
jgi:hypothetical protein